jgi:hypothetical protein
MHVNPLLGFGLDPSACNATARKHQSMRAVPIDDGEFKITVSPAKGAETIVYLASSPDVAETTGQYFYKSVPTMPSSWAKDDRSALLLWQRSAALAGMKE